MPSESFNEHFERNYGPPKHSTGPWFVDPESAHPWKVCARYDDGLPGHAVLFTVSYRPNAFMAAAAPEMHTALKRCTELLASATGLPPKEVATALAAANAALAKAEAA